MKRKSAHAPVELLPTAEIVPSPYQARQTFDEAALRELAMSILHNGLLQPISVRKTQDGRYQLIAGERRLRACRMVGVETIPAVVYEFTDDRTAALGLLENMQRRALDPFEQAEGLRELLAMWRCPKDIAAKRLGISVQTLRAKLRLLLLTDEERGICRSAGLTEGHARAVLRIADPTARKKVFETVVKKRYNVSQTRALVERTLRPAPPKKKPAVMVRDARLFANTIDRAVRLLTAGGVPATSERREGDGYCEYVVRIPMTRAERRARPAQTSPKKREV